MLLFSLIFPQNRLPIRSQNMEFNISFQLRLLEPTLNDVGFNRSFAIDDIMFGDTCDDILHPSTMSDTTIQTTASYPNVNVIIKLYGKLLVELFCLP
jgi:hypothetical protein